MKTRSDVKRVIQWAKERNILTHSTLQAQHAKFLEEVEELKEALVDYEILSEQKNLDKKQIDKKMTAYQNIIDAIGDIQVTLIVQSQMLKLDYDHCLNYVLPIIEKRTGKIDPVTKMWVKDDPDKVKLAASQEPNELEGM